MTKEALTGGGGGSPATHGLDLAVKSGTPVSRGEEWGTGAGTQVAFVRSRRKRKPHVGPSAGGQRRLWAAEGGGTWAGRGSEAGRACAACLWPWGPDGPPPSSCSFPILPFPSSEGWR